MTIKIYVDGACIGNPGPGGWGVYIPSLDPPLELYGSEPRSTNNRMEMQAAIEALRAMPDGADILILSDSTHLRENPLALVMGRKAGSWF